MKAGKIIKSLGLSIFAASLMYETSFAVDWTTILRGIKLIEGSNIIDDNKPHKGQLYNAILEFQFLNGNGDNYFQENEQVYLKVIAPDGTIIETQDYLNKDELAAWADGRAEALLEAVFTSDPLQVTSGQSMAISTTQQVTETILEGVTTADTYYQEIREEVNKGIEKVTEKLEEQKEENTGKKKIKELTVKTYTTEVKLDSEVGKIKNYGYDGDSKGSRFDPNFKIGKNYVIGSVIAYRTVDIDDEWDSKTKTLTIIPYVRYIKQINDKWDLTTVGFAQLGLVYLKSQIFPDGAGYLSFGGGFSLVPQYKITDKLKAHFLGGYSFSKKYIPESEVPDDLKFVATAINRLEPMHILTTSVGLNYEILKGWFADASISYVRIFKADDLPEGRRKANYYVVKTYYIREVQWRKFKFKLNLGLGYKMVRNVSDYKEDAYMLTAGIRF